MANSRAIVPKGLLVNIPAMRRTVGNALTGAAKGAKADFGVTTRTWDDKPTFTIEKPSEFERTVSTTNKVYIGLDEGTPPHDIRPKRGRFLVFQTPFRSKTIPNDIRSRKGATGKQTVFARVVHHPGTKPRNFAEVIGKKWQKQLPEIMQRAIDSAVE
jgi:hypothetical protein